MLCSCMYLITIDSCFCCFIGYLLEEGCEEAAKTFLETSPNLVECKQRIKQGKRLTLANTLLLGRSLSEVLNISCNVHSLCKY